MAATTISRATWTDGAAGTVVNNARLQADVYDKIDALFTAAFTFGSTLTVDGFGGHTFSAGGAGTNILRVRNTTAGTGNAASVQVGNDSSYVLDLYAFSSTYTSSGSDQANGARVNGSGAGGLSVLASHAAGVLRLYAGGYVERMRVNEVGGVFIGDTSNVNAPVGLTINQLTDANEILAFKGSSIAHGMTTLAETDTYAAFTACQSTTGGLRIEGYSETYYGLDVFANVTLEDATRSTAALGAIRLNSYLKSGTSASSMSGDRNLLVVTNATVTRFILDSDGDSHQDVGTAWINFDDRDDVLTLNALAYHVARPGDPYKDLIRARFGRDLDVFGSRDVLTRAQIVTFNRDGHHFVNMSKLAMLHTGAIRQLGDHVYGDVEERLRRLEQQAAA